MFELAFTAQQVNTAPNEQFAHAVEFWRRRTDNPNSTDLSGEGVALSLVWAGNIAWTVTSRLPGPGFAFTNIRLQIPFAEQRTVRIAHRTDGRAEFAVDGRSVLTLERPAAEDQVFARVVGARADFSYEPLAGVRPARAAHRVVRCRGDAPCCRCARERQST